MSDSTTFKPPPVIEPDEGNDPTSSFIGLPRVEIPETWKCRVCGYSPIDRGTKFCFNCGRDFYGNPGQVPKANDKPPRAGLRSDGR